MGRRRPVTRAAWAAGSGGARRGVHDGGGSTEGADAGDRAVATAHVRQVMLRRLFLRPLPEWGAAIHTALASIRIAVRDWVRPPKVVLRKEATHEGITFRVPAGYDGSVWDDIGLSVALHADTLEPVSAHVTPQEKRGLDVVQVVVRWEDWNHISAWVDDTSPSHQESDVPGDAPVPAELRRVRAPQGTCATDMFLLRGRAAQPVARTLGRR